MKQERHRRILFLLSSYDWMRAYSMAALDRLFNADCHAVIVLENDENRSDFAHLPQDCLTFFSIPKSPVERRMFFIFPKKMVQCIESIIESRKIELVCSLTIDIILSRYLPRLQHRVPVLYTVHNAEPHPSRQKSLLARLNYYFLFQRPQKQLVKLMRHTVTNSISQLRLLNATYPDHDNGYLPFPSLVTTGMANGTKKVPELAGVSGYILFFGRVELYKGVHLLYNTYRNHPELHRHKLVIAGKGKPYFPTEPSKDIIFIDRFIDDKEIADLFSKAAVVAYPYISATQSGVLSVASYFGKPMLLGNVDFFKDTADGYPGIDIIDIYDNNLFADSLLKLMDGNLSSRELYDKVYAADSWLASFSQIVDRTILHTLHQ